MEMNQSKIDSILETITNTLIRAPINMTANTVIFPALGYEITIVQNFSFMVIFTVISLVTAYCIRRLFNGKSVYRAIKNYGQ